MSSMAEGTWFVYVLVSEKGGASEWMRLMNLHVWAVEPAACPITTPTTTCCSGMRK